MITGKNIFLAIIVGVALIAGFAARQKLTDTWRKTLEFFHEVIEEMRKVAWPSKQDVIDKTVLVTIATIALMIMIGVVDKGFGMLVGLIFSDQ